MQEPEHGRQHLHESLARNEVDQQKYDALLKARDDARIALEQFPQQNVILSQIQSLESELGRLQSRQTQLDGLSDDEEDEKEDSQEDDEIHQELEEINRHIESSSDQLKNLREIDKQRHIAEDNYEKTCNAIRKAKVVQTTHQQPIEEPIPLVQPTQNMLEAAIPLQPPPAPRPIVPTTSTSPPRETSTAATPSVANPLEKLQKLCEEKDWEFSGDQKKWNITLANGAKINAETTKDKTTITSSDEDPQTIKAQVLAMKTHLEGLNIPPDKMYVKITSAKSEQARKLLEKFCKEENIKVIQEPSSRQEQGPTIPPQSADRASASVERRLSQP